MDQGYRFVVYILAFFASVYVLKPLKFDKFMKVNEPFRCQILYLLLSMALAYLVGSFLLEMRLI